MRVSTNETDEGYINWLNREDRVYIVYLDGEELKHCQTADEEKGYAQCAKLDADGQYIINNDEFVTVDYFGKVEIKAEEC